VPQCSRLGGAGTQRAERTGNRRIPSGTRRRFETAVNLPARIPDFSKRFRHPSHDLVNFQFGDYYNRICVCTRAFTRSRSGIVRRRRSELVHGRARREYFARIVTGNRSLPCSGMFLAQEPWAFPRSKRSYEEPRRNHPMWGRLQVVEGGSLGEAGMPTLASVLKITDPAQRRRRFSTHGAWAAAMDVDGVTRTTREAFVCRNSAWRARYLARVHDAFWYRRDRGEWPALRAGGGFGLPRWNTGSSVNESLV